ncbi:hypothetical protein QCA50_003751 [Cerrena zonata]|uniref:Uncharacterized protein n=1 Tax=Cerrena zonata TaxID=2478898 RepID=A0AAW0GJS1_9APHY
MSSLSSISSLSGLPSPANSTRSRSDNLRQNLTHTIGKNGGKGRNVITTKSVFRPDLSVSAHWHFHAGPGHGTRSHASPSTGSSSHDHRQDNSGTRRGGRNSYSSLPPRSYSSQRRPSSPSSSSCNEAPFQALRTCPQVPVPSSPSSPPPPSPASRMPRTPRRVHHDYAFLEPSSSVASSYSRTSCPYPASGQTSSPSPRSKSKANSHSRSPSATLPPPAFLIRRGIQRAPPTLAMSIQIHSPTPILSSRPTSPSPHPHSHHRSNPRSASRSKSRPTSPLQPSAQLPPIPSRPPMARPPSRSERLLRDTLRRAEEQDRIANLAALPSPSILGASQPAHGFSSPRRHVRRNTNSSTGTDASLEGSDYFKPEVFGISQDEEQDADEGGWLWRTRSATSASSSSSGHHPTRAPPNSRQQVAGSSRNRSHTDPTGGRVQEQQFAYGTPTSPPMPTRAQLQRSPKSVPNVSRSSRTSLENHHGPDCGCGSNAGMTPHEVVLRSRLENVLRGAKEQERREERERRRESQSGSGSGSGNSMASSRNLSGEGEWFFGSNGDTHTTSSAESATTRYPHRQPFNLALPPVPRTPSSHSRSHSHAHKMLSNVSSPTKSAHRHLSGPLTPPPTPPFNARTAAEQLKHMDGYVSFANIEGLGCPDDLDGENDEEEDDRTGGARWLKWLNLGKGSAGEAGSTR